MPTIHLMVCFIGFGKTTIAKELEQNIPAVRFTHDEIMFERYGRTPDNFSEKYKLVDEFICAQVAENIRQGRDVILDYGFWTHDKREEYYQWARTLTDKVVFHVVECDIQEARRRTLTRTQNDTTALMIDENIFDALLKQYQPWSYLDDYPAVWHQVSA